MSKSNVFENDLLKLIFNGTPIAGLANNASSSPLTNLYLALHTQDPGEAGTQETNEVAYGGYSRMAIERTTDGWRVTGNSVSPAKPTEFPEMISGSSDDAIYLTVGTHLTGAGKVLYRGALNNPIPLVLGTIPRIKTDSTITED